jgi:hypothetical protein
VPFREISVKSEGSLLLFFTQIFIPVNMGIKPSVMICGKASQGHQVVGTPQNSPSASA